MAEMIRGNLQVRHFEEETKSRGTSNIIAQASAVSERAVNFDKLYPRGSFSSEEDR